MKVNDWLKWATAQLEEVEISSARLDSLILLEDTTGKDRSWLLAHTEFEIGHEQKLELEAKLKRRKNHEPLAYIHGKSEFYGREFIVTPATLQPRPETETMLELFINYSNNIESVIDVGTGTGAIAITIKLENPDIVVWATDISSYAFEIANNNAKILGADINFFQGNLFEPLPAESFSLSTAILANLPYVPDGYMINKSASQEPEISIFGGPDGLNLYRQMFNQINGLVKKPTMLLTESLVFQHKELKSIALNSGYTCTQSKDLIQVFSFQE